MPLIGAAPVAPSSLTVPAAAPSVNLAPVVPVNQAISVPGTPANPTVSVPTVLSAQANPIAPAMPPAVNPVVPAVPSAIHTTTSLTPSPVVDGDFVSVQWVETKIDGTLRTWVPKTITFNFHAHTTQGPLPGKGEIGMGTLTGDTGRTKTVVMGAAPTYTPGWMRGVAVAVGVGFAGMVV